mgnify:CR=1 FL=1
MRILMHMCCASCTAQPLEILHGQGIRIDGLYYKKSLHDDETDIKHETEIKQFSQDHHLNVFVYPKIDETKYIHDEDCLDEIRIKKTFELGKDLGYDAVTTSLLASPNFSQERIIEIGLKYSKIYELPFYYQPFMNT